MALRVIPLTRGPANAAVARWHRHHKPVTGFRFALGVVDGDGVLRGAAIVGRPRARKVDQYMVAEVTRLVTDGSKNACSILYAAAARACQAMGFLKIQTYILDTEPGTSLRGAGWVWEADTAGGDWNRPSRGGRRVDQPQGPKQRWAKYLNPPVLIVEEQSA
jgi:hypothetical protein